MAGPKPATNTGEDHMIKSRMIAAAVLTAALGAMAADKEPVRLFLEDNGSPGKINGLTLADQNLHPMDGFFYNENYFFIAIDDSGYYGYVNLLISSSGLKPMQPALSFTIVTPDNRRLVRDVDFQPEDLVMEKDHFELRLKDNLFRQTVNGYELRIAHQGLGMDLVYRNRVPGLVLGNGRAEFGEKREDFFYINYPGPRPEVTGEFMVEGKKVPVKGWGYIDHSLTSTDPTGFEGVWHNMKFRSDTHTVLISSFTTPEKYEKDFGFAVVTDDEKVLCAFTDVRVTEHDVAVDPESGKPYPARVSYQLVGDNCAARATVDSSRITEKFDVLAKLDQKWYGKPVKLAINTFIAEPWYFRAVTPVEVEIDIKGEIITVRGNAFNEIIFTE